MESIEILWGLGAFLLPFCDYLKMSQVALEYSSYIVCIVPNGDCLEVSQIFETPEDLRYVLYDMYYMICII